jgi:hypothetical protein
VIVAGYTRGDLDGQHAGANSDDAFVVRLSADGEIMWTLQFGDAGEADRLYGLALGENGMVYTTGYTRAALGSENLGDKDIIVAGISGDGTLSWLEQFGGTGEDKGYSVAVDGDRVYIAGVIATDAGGLDAFVSAYSLAGEQAWTQSFGTLEWDEAQGVAVGPDGMVYVTGFVAGALGENEFFGDKDVFTAAFGPDGDMLWNDQLGTPGNDKGAAIVAHSGGDVYAAGYSDQGIDGTAGGFDVVVLRYFADGQYGGGRQLGSESDDGADEWAEKNLFITVAGETLLMSGLSGGDVFVETFDMEE